MTLFDDDRYDWRETYFVYFESAFRPKLTDVRRALKLNAPFIEILNTETEPTGGIIQMTIASYEDHAALEIVYQEGNSIQNEAQHLADSLKQDASDSELVQINKISLCNTRFEIHHFEQTAETRTFKITKVPEITFPKKKSKTVGRDDVFSKALTPEKSLPGIKPPGMRSPHKAAGSSKVGNNTGSLHFDADSYSLCRFGPTGKTAKTFEHDSSGIDTLDMDSGYERINPEMLVSVLEVFCRISRGVAIDPASGIILE